MLQNLPFSSMWITPAVPTSQLTVLVWVMVSPTSWLPSQSSQRTPLKVRVIHFIFHYLTVCFDSVQSRWPSPSLSPGGLDLAIEGPSKAEISCVDNKDGTCTVSYLPTLPGDYNILVKYNDEHIAGSPFTARITGQAPMHNISTVNCLAV